MPSLRYIQEKFFDAVLVRNGVESSKFRAGEIQPSEDRLEIYRANIFSNHLLALKDTYPVCERLVGEKYFKQLANEYFIKYPPVQQDLNTYGDRFAQYLISIVELKTEAAVLMYLPDLAALEWAIYDSRRSASESVFDFEDLGRLTETEQGEVVFTLSQSLTLLRSEYPIHRIWEANEAKKSSATEIDISKGGSNLVIWNKNGRPMIRTIADNMFQMLDSVRQGYSLGRLSSEFGSTVSAAVPSWVQNGWLIGWRIQE